MPLEREEVESIAKIAAQAAIKELFAEFDMKPHHFVYIVAEYEKAKNRMSWREKAFITVLVTAITLATFGIATNWIKQQVAQHYTQPPSRNDP